MAEKTIRPDEDTNKTIRADGDTVSGGTVKTEGTVTAAGSAPATAGTVKADTGGPGGGTVAVGSRTVKAGKGGAPAPGGSSKATISAGGRQKGDDFASARIEAAKGKSLLVNGVSYVITKVISQGVTGEADIYLVEGPEGNPYVLKQYRERAPKESILEQLKGLDHPNIIKALDYGTSREGKFCEIMEYARGGTLDQYLPIKAQPRLVQIIREVNEGFKYCHDMGIIHRDIKPGNLFCRNSDGTDIMIADFGISSLLKEGESRKMTTMGFTLGYAAPETFGLTINETMEAKPIIGKEADYYALGFTLINIWLGYDPFENKSFTEVFHLIQSGNIELPEDLDHRFATLIRGLIHRNYLYRWGYEEVSRWLNGEEVELPADESELEEKVKPYPFIQRDGETVYAHSPEEMAVLLQEYPEEGVSRLRRGDIADWVKEVNLPLSHAIRDVMEVMDEDTDANRGSWTKFPMTPEYALYKTIYLLNPRKPFRGPKGEEASYFEDMQALLESTGDAVERDLIKSGWNGTKGGDKRIFHRLLLYLDALGKKEYTREIRGFFEKDEVEAAVNRSLLLLQGKEVFKFQGRGFYTYEDLKSAGEGVHKILVSLLHSTNSKFLVWLEDMGLKLDSRDISHSHPAELVELLKNMPWIRKFDKSLADRLNERDETGWTDLMKMAREGDLATCKELVAAGADINAQAGDGTTALTVAALHEQLGIMDFLIEQGADLNDINNAGKGIMHQALEAGKVTSALKLIDAGADVNLRCTEDDWTPLRTAVNLGYIEVAQRLLKKGADPNIKAEKSDSFTPLFNAVNDNSMELTELLLAHGADMNALDDGGWPPIGYAARDNALDTLELLLKKGADPNVTGDGFTMLHGACENGNMEAMKILLEYGADPRRVYSFQDKDGKEWKIEPLHSAVWNDRKKAAELLLKTGVDPDVLYNGWTLLTTVVDNQNEEMTALLLQHGADPDLENHDGFTPLMLAVQRDGNETIISMLLNAGADPNHCDETGWSLLHETADSGRTSYMELLIDKGANMERKYDNPDDPWGVVPLFFALWANQPEAVELLLKKGCNPNPTFTPQISALRNAIAQGKNNMVPLLLEYGAKVKGDRDSGGSNPFHIAVKYQNGEALKMLLEGKAGMNEKDKDGYTPLMLAANNGEVEMVRALLEAGAKAAVRDKRVRGSAEDFANETAKNKNLAREIAEHRGLEKRRKLFALGVLVLQGLGISLALYSFFYFAARDFLLYSKLQGNFWYLLLAGGAAFHLALWYSYLTRAGAVKWILDPKRSFRKGPIAFIKTTILQPALIGAILYLLVSPRLFQSIPFLGRFLRTTGEVNRFLDPHIFQHILGGEHAAKVMGFLNGVWGGFSFLTPPLVYFGYTLIILSVLGAAAFFVGREVEDCDYTLKRIYSTQY